MRRRQRRLRKFLRHERLTVALALAEATHHAAPRRQKPASATVYDAPRGQKNADAEYFELSSDEEVASARGSRPAPLWEPRPQDRVERHHGEHIDEICPFVPILDVSEPQMGAQVVEFLHAIDTAIPEQVIEVPRLSPDRIPLRSLDRRPQSAEQLVEVPTDLGYVLAIIAKKFYTRRQISSMLESLSASSGERWGRENSGQGPGG